MEGTCLECCVARAVIHNDNLPCKLGILLATLFKIEECFLNGGGHSLLFVVCREYH
jgi:hypothetical protein